jgi:hypothetical protein
MNKLNKIFYTAGLYIFSMEAFADDLMQNLNCSTVNIASYCKLLSMFGIPIVLVGIVMQLPGLVISGLMIGLMFYIAPMLINSLQPFNDSDVCPPAPETHYWQSIVSFLGTACYLVLPLIGIAVVIGIIAVVIELSYTKSFNTNQEALIKLKSGELLFFLNQLYRQLPDGSHLKKSTLDMICKIHEAKCISIDELKYYVNTYREIRTNISVLS